jgi:hypothetical protein
VPADFVFRIGTEIDRRPIEAQVAALTRRAWRGRYNRFAIDRAVAWRGSVTSSRDRLSAVNQSDQNGCLHRSRLFPLDWDLVPPLDWSFTALAFTHRLRQTEFNSKFWWPLTFEARAMKRRLACAAIATFALSAGGYAEPMHVAKSGGGPFSVIIFDAGPSVIYPSDSAQPAANTAPSQVRVTDTPSGAVDRAEPPPIIKADSPSEVGAQPLPEPRVVATPVFGEDRLLPPPPQRFPHRSPPRAGKPALSERVAAMPKQPPLPKPKPESAIGALPKRGPSPHTKPSIEWLIPN